MGERYKAQHKMDLIKDSKNVDIEAAIPTESQQREKALLADKKESGEWGTFPFHPLTTFEVDKDREEQQRE